MTALETWKKEEKELRQVVQLLFDLKHYEEMGDKLIQLNQLTKNIREVENDKRPFNKNKR